jgi:hypothetical protein
VSTEVITSNVPLDYFESKGTNKETFSPDLFTQKPRNFLKTIVYNKGFYTYLYIGSITFMCYIFFYVLRVRVQGHALNHNKLEMDEFIKRMTQATGGCLSTGWWLVAIG